MLARLFDSDLGTTYARALLAIARADSEISPEEGEQLAACIAARCEEPPSLADLLFEPTLTVDELAQTFRNATAGGPFRSTPIDPVDVAEALVTDAVSIALTKGHISDGEGARLRRFADALGLPQGSFEKLVP